MLQQNQFIMKRLILLAVFTISTTALSQYGYRDGNRIGISGGISQATLFTSNFQTKPEMGYAGGLSIRGNYYDNWSMIYGMQFFVNNFSMESTTTTLKPVDTKFSLSGVQIRLLLSYNIIKDHISVDFGPILQVNGKMSIASTDEKNNINGTLLKANQVIDVTKINGNVYFGISGGSKVVRALIFYEYGVNNILNNLNNDTALVIANGNKTFKGNIGSINGQIIFNL